MAETANTNKGIESPRAWRVVVGMVLLRTSAPRTDGTAEASPAN